MTEIILKLENLTKKFGNFTAVNNVNLEVCRGETIGLVGPNGAGKTTTIKMIAKILRPNSGKILIRTNHSELEDLQHVSTTVTQIGFLIDIPNFYNMTAYQLLKYFAKLQNYPKDKIEERIDDLLALFKLSDWKHENVKTFSKGMTQKLGIIQAIIHDPEIIILDEPQTGLDPLARVEIRRYIRELQSLGKTTFVASHMLYEISEVCDKIALINYGEIID
jgi:ABC-2 type transport system ATP-binding protein